MARIGSSGGPSTGGTPSDINTVQVSVDFGFEGPPFGEGDTTLNVVSATWVTSSTAFMCQFLGVETVDHDPEDPVVEDLNAYITNSIPGVGFTLECIAPQNTWGIYTVQVIGIG